MSQPAKPRAACPICGRGASAADSPFCSPVCRDRDLLNWLGDAYALPGPPAGEADLAAADGSGDVRLDKD